MAELQIQHRLAQVRVGLAVGQQIAGAAEQLGLLLMLFEPTGHFAVGAAVGQHPNGSPLALRFGAASAWMETSTLAPCLRATSERPITEMK